MFTSVVELHKTNTERVLFASLMLHLHNQPNVNNDFSISKGIAIDLSAA